MADPRYVLRFEQVNLLLKQKSAYFQVFWQPVTELQDALLVLLNQVFASVFTWSAWSASTAVSLGSSIENGNFRYVATTAGTTGGSIPSFPVTIGATVTDGGVTWECVQRLPLIQYDEIFTEASQAIGQISNDHEGAHLAKQWSKANGCTVAVDDWVHIYNGRDDGSGNSKVLHFIAIVTTSGTLGDEPDYLNDATITRGSTVTNTNGTATLVLNEASCSVAGTETCPTFVDFHDCQNNLKDVDYLLDFINNLLLRKTS